jgi:hypothetical protein
MLRRELIAGLGSTAARVQQRQRLRRVDVLMSTSDSDPETQARVAAQLAGSRCA